MLCLKTKKDCGSCRRCHLKPTWLKGRKGYQGAEEIPLWNLNGYLGSEVEGTEREGKKKTIIGRDPREWKERDKQQKKEVQGKARLDADILYILL